MTTASPQPIATSTLTDVQMVIDMTIRTVELYVEEDDDNELHMSVTIDALMDGVTLELPYGRPDETGAYGMKSQPWYMADEDQHKAIVQEYAGYWAKRMNCNVTSTETL